MRLDAFPNLTELMVLALNTGRPRNCVRTAPLCGAPKLQEVHLYDLYTASRMEAALRILTDSPSLTDVHLDVGHGAQLTVGVQQVRGRLHVSFIREASEDEMELLRGMPQVVELGWLDPVPAALERLFAPGHALAACRFRARLAVSDALARVPGQLDLCMDSSNDLRVVPHDRVDDLFWLVDGPWPSPVDMPLWSTLHTLALEICTHAVHQCTSRDMTELAPRLPNLARLRIRYASQLVDLAFLRAYPRLVTLSLYKCGPVHETDVDHLASLRDATSVCVRGSFAPRVLASARRRLPLFEFERVR
jgi:hypothetical protein